MKDTPADVERRYERMVIAQSPADRLRMGMRMHEGSRRLVWAALRAQHPDADEGRLRRLFIERFYGDELPSDVKDRIAAWRPVGAPLTAFHVEESFQITGRGAAVVTLGDLSMLRQGAFYSVRFEAPDGRTGTATATRETVIRRLPAVHEKFALVLKDTRKEAVPAGTHVVVVDDAGR